jgi:hypothetical protein
VFETRIASLPLANDLSSFSHPFFDVCQGHHLASYGRLADGCKRLSRRSWTGRRTARGTVLASRTCGPGGSTTRKSAVLLAGGVGGTPRTDSRIMDRIDVQLDHFGHFGDADSRKARRRQALQPPLKQSRPRRPSQSRSPPALPAPDAGCRHGCLVSGSETTNPSAGAILPPVAFN